MFNEGMSKEDAINYGQKQKTSKGDMDKVIDNMSDEDRSTYLGLSKRLRDTKLSDAEKENIISGISSLYEKYQYE